MPDTVINIVRKPGDRIEPESGFRVRVPSRSVKFTAAAPAKGLRIIFEGESPFGSKEVAYNQSLPVTVKFNATDPKKNIYPFVCEITVDGKTLRTKAGAGGEMEVILEP